MRRILTHTIAALSGAALAATATGYAAGVGQAPSHTDMQQLVGQLRELNGNSFAMNQTLNIRLRWLCVSQVGTLDQARLTNLCGAS